VASLSHRLACVAQLASTLACVSPSEILIKRAQPPCWSSVSGEVYEISLASPRGRRLFDNHTAETPYPSELKLRNTDAARVREDGQLVIGFCIDKKGNTTAVVVEGFPGDPAIDEIVLGSVEEWGFYPFRVDGKPVVVCGEHKFIIDFY
jgi:hypothetical protein